MGAKFYPSHESGRPLIRCTCEALDLEPLSCPSCQLDLDLNERNWRDLLRYLELPVEPCGKRPAPELAALCRAKLAAADVHSIITAGPLPADRPIEAVETVGKRGAWCITGRREAGYLNGRVRDLLKIALSAGDAWVSWG
jgi:hypothetical protein